MGNNFGVALAQVTDGLSNSMFFGELRAGLNSLDIRGTWAIGYAGASLCCHAKNYNPTPNATFMIPRPTAATAATSCRGATPSPRCSPTAGSSACPAAASRDIATRGGQSRSMHPGGVNVGMGDGSVRFIKNTIANQVWFELLVSNDGWILSSDQY